MVVPIIFIINMARADEVSETIVTICIHKDSFNHRTDSSFELLGSVLISTGKLVVHILNKRKDFKCFSHISQSLTVQYTKYIPNIQILNVKIMLKFEYRL